MKYTRQKKIIQDYGAPEFQPCWTCKRSCGGCCWSREFKPVPGWIAEQNFIKANGEHVETYKIISCPQYLEDRRFYTVTGEDYEND